MPEDDSSEEENPYATHLDIKQLRKLCYSKRLNFLLGAGASHPAIPTLEDGKNLETLITLICETSRHLAEDQVVENRESETLDAYVSFVSMIIAILNLSNSRAVPRSANIFTTNYDLFIEAAMDRVIRDNYGIIFNDGANGYFRRYVNTFNYDRSTVLRGQFDNYNHETPAIRLIKPHGSVNWKKHADEGDHDYIEVFNRPVKEGEPFIVPPDKYESGHTMENRHFFEMLRLFNIELDKPQSMLFVIGFSFQDEHIKGMVRRALQNPGLQVCIFAYSDDTSEPDSGNARKGIESNLGTISNPNLLILSPRDVASFLIGPMKHDSDHSDCKGKDSRGTEDKPEDIRLNLKTVTKLLMPNSIEGFSAQLSGKTRNIQNE